MTMREKLTWVSHSESETDLLSAALSRSLTTGLTIALNGNLGAGKTRFVRGLCTALGVSEALITSPTFVLMQLYTDGRIPIAHFDTYRLAGSDEFLSFGAGDYLQDEDWLCLIEWAERVEDVLPEDRLTISIQHASESSRSFHFLASGNHSRALLGRMTENLRTIHPDSEPI